ncbi:MAG: SRPBCC domain-containing protein [Burkholderiaceae bacterium]|nr:SRPBCC domain-containing protein [Burkholderiaceae bacterium]
MNLEPSADGICATSRLLPFNRMDVFAAFSDPDCLATWWGPDGFSNTFELFDFKPQGRWKFTMHGPDGTNYPNESVFLEASPANIVIQHICQPYFTLTITLEDDNGGTMLRWSQAFQDPQVAKSIWHIIKPANEQNLNRLHMALSAKAASL